MKQKNQDLLQVIRYLRNGEPSDMYNHIRLNYQNYESSVLADIIKELLQAMDEFITHPLTDAIMNFAADEFSMKHDIYEE